MLTPEEIAGRRFLVTLRGYDRSEVEAFLAEVADHVRALEQRLGAAGADTGAGELLTELEALRDRLAADVRAAGELLREPPPAVAPPAVAPPTVASPSVAPPAVAPPDLATPAVDGPADAPAPAGAVADADEGAASTATPPPGDDVGPRALAARRDALAEVQPEAVRRLRRVLADVQNGVLAALRSVPAPPSLDDLLPDEEALAPLAEVATEPLARSYGLGLLAGAELTGRGRGDEHGDTTRVVTAAAALRAALAHEVTAALRATLGAGIQASEPQASLSERVGEVFRDLKGPVAETVVEQHLARAFGDGQLDAWRALGVAGKRWVPGTAPRCPEEMRLQNADAGGVALDGEFPTGQRVPPAHDGCTCALAPVTAAPSAR